MHTCCFNSRLLGTEAASNEEEILVWPAGSYYFLDRRLYSTCDPAPGRMADTHCFVGSLPASKQEPKIAHHLRSLDRWQHLCFSVEENAGKYARVQLSLSLSLPAEELAGS
jgi:hypothetical protein